MQLSTPPAPILQSLTPPLFRQERAQKRPLKTPRHVNRSNMYESHKALHEIAERKLLLKREEFEELKNYHQQKLEAINRKTTALENLSESLTKFIVNKNS